MHLIHTCVEAQNLNRPVEARPAPIWKSPEDQRWYLRGTVIQFCPYCGAELEPQQGSSMKLYAESRF